MNTLELNNYNVKEMSEFEIQLIEGGAFWGIAARVGLRVLVGAAGVATGAGLVIGAGLLAYEVYELMSE